MSDPRLCPCPSCGHPLQIGVVGWLKKRPKIPAFCCNCGTKLFSSCPECITAIESPSVYCSNCGKKLYTPCARAEEVQAERPVVDHPQTKKIPPKQKQLLLGLMVDIRDLSIYWRECWRVFIWSNEISQTMNAFRTKLEEIGEKTSPDDVVRIVNQAFASVSFKDPSDTLAELEQHLTTAVKSLTCLWSESLAKVAPEPGEWPAVPPNSEVQSALCSQISDVISRSRTDVERLQAEFKRVKQRLPGYRRMMTKSDLLGPGATAAAYYFAGIVGGIIAEGVTGELQKSDQEFIDSFARDIDGLIEAGQSLTVGIEEELQPTIGQLLTYLVKTSETVIKGLGRAAAHGADVEPVVQEVRFTDRANDDGTRQFNQLIIENLREQRLIEIRAETNLRVLLGLAQ